MKYSIYYTEVLPFILIFLVSDEPLTSCIRKDLFKKVKMTGSSYPHYSAVDTNCAFLNEVTHFLLRHLSHSNESYDYYEHLETIFQSPEFLEKFISLSRGEWIFIYIFGILFALAIGGNFLVCFAVLRNEHMQTVTNYYIVNLSISDILMIILCMPSTVMYDFLDTWYFGLLGCKILPYFQVSRLHLLALQYWGSSGVAPGFALQGAAKLPDEGVATQVSNTGERMSSANIRLASSTGNFSVSFYKN